METFSQLFSEVLGNEDWRSQVHYQEKKGEDLPLVKKLKERISQTKGKQEVEALSIGMELEQRAIQLFEEAARQTTDKEAREIFRKIVEEEKFHYDLLQAQQDSLTRSGYWLDSSDFKMDGLF
jgi:rubrerythrin